MTNKVRAIGEKYILQKEQNIVIIDTYGAKVLAFITKDGNRLFYDEDDIAHSGVPLCFPNFGPLQNNELIIDGVSFPMKQHGFIRNMEFSFISKTDSSITLALNSDSKTRLIYPSDFYFEITFKISKTKLSIQFNWKNLGEIPAPLSPGVHPYFSVYDREAIILQSNAVRYNLSRDFSEIENIIESKYLDIANKNSFVINGAPDINLINHNLEETKVNLGAEKYILIKYNTVDFNRLTVWRKSYDTDYICIEPANAQNKINENPYLVQSGECWVSEVSIVFK